MDRTLANRKDIESACIMFRKKHSERKKLFKIAVKRSISEILYAIYIQSFQKIYEEGTDRYKIHTPVTEEFLKILDLDGNFMQLCIEKLLPLFFNDTIFETPFSRNESVRVLFRKVSTRLLCDEPIMDAIVRSFIKCDIIKNLYDSFRDILKEKFQEGSIFVEDPEITVLSISKLTMDELNELADYIREETFLNLLCLSTKTKRKTIPIRRNKYIEMTHDDILTINNPQLLFPVHFNSRIIQMPRIIDILSYVTNTTFTEQEFSSVAVACRDFTPIEYFVISGLENQVTLTEIME